MPVRLGSGARRAAALAALATLGLVAAACLLAPLVAPYDPEAGALVEALTGPTPTHWLGTDELGRDVLSRLLWGGRVSLGVALAVTLVAPLVGTAYGLLAAALPRLTGQALMQLVDGLLGLPRLPVYLVLLAVVGAGVWPVIVVLALFEWPAFARLSYLGALGQRRAPHVEAARALGASEARIVRAHMLPLAAGPLVVAATAGVRGRIVAETSLSYLGFGIAPPTPSWGNMLAAAQSRVWDEPLLAVYPGLAILLVSVAASLLGDALRDALDPTTARTGASGPR